MPTQENEISDIPVFKSIEELRNSIGIRKDYFYTSIYSNDKFYRTISIPKKRGGERIISVPFIGLKGIQRWILDNILYKIPVEACATGFIPLKSILFNAAPHVRKNYILKMDIKDFFPSIDFTKVRKVFFELGYNTSVATALAKLCTYEGKLPQGAPTSPYLANIICRNMDKNISDFCKKNSLKYTRYADDITISSNNRINWVESVVVNILLSYQFIPNREKTILLGPGDRKQVTGIIVNEKLSIPKSVIREMRKNIHFIQRFGLEKHLHNIGVEDNQQKYISHLYGVANYIKMVEPSKGLLIKRQLDQMLFESPKKEDLPEFMFEEIVWTIFDEL